MELPILVGPHNLIIDTGDGEIVHMFVKNPKQVVHDATILGINGGMLRVIDIHNGREMVLGSEALHRAVITAYRDEPDNHPVLMEEEEEEGCCFGSAPVKREGSIDVDSLRGEINAMIANGKSNAKIGMRLIQIGEELIGYKPVGAGGGARNAGS